MRCKSTTPAACGLACIKLRDSCITGLLYMVSELRILPWMAVAFHGFYFKGG